MRLNTYRWIILLCTFVFAIPAQAQTLEERVTALENLTSQQSTLIASLQTEIATLQSSNAALVTNVTDLQNLLNGVSRLGSTLRLTGLNLQVV